MQPEKSATNAPSAPGIYRQENPLGAASIALAGIGLAICLCGAFWGVMEQQKRLANSNRTANASHRAGDLPVLVDQVADGVSLFSQLFVYGVSALVGGTFSLIGFALGVSSLPNKSSRLGLVAIALSPLGPLLLMICFFLL